MKDHIGLEKIIIFIIICAISFSNSLPSIIGFINTPNTHTFLGTVHYPWDYYYYLSQFTQGKDSSFFGSDLYTGEYKGYNLVEWVNMFLGFTFSKIGVGSIMAYQMAIFIFATTYLFVSYKVIFELFPEKKDWIVRLFFLLLFIFNNSFPMYAFYLSSGPAFNRLGGVPHHLFARTFHMLFIYLFLRWQRNGRKDPKRILEIILCAVSGFVSASVDPVQFVLLGGGIFIGYLLYWVYMVVRKLETDFKTLLFGLFPLLIFATFGIPMVFYLRDILFNPPYNQSIAWGASQQIRVTLSYFLLAIGPVAILSIPDIVLSIRKINLPKLIASMQIILPVALFFSGIPARLNSSNSRVISPVMVFAMTYLSIDLLVYLVRKCGKVKLIAVSILVIIGAVFLVPLYVNQLIPRTKLDFVYSYISKNDFNAIMKIGTLTTPRDTILANLPFNWFIPAVVGRRVYEGHEIMTYDVQRKEKLRTDFFNSKMDKTEIRNFLNKESIDYIFSYAGEDLYKDLPEIQQIYTDGHLSLYKIQKI